MRGARSSSDESLGAKNLLVLGSAIFSQKLRLRHFAIDSKMRCEFGLRTAARSGGRIAEGRDVPCFSR